MLLEIFRFVPKELIDNELLNKDLDELYRVYAKARYMQDIEVGLFQKAIVQAFGEE